MLPSQSSTLSEKQLEQLVACLTTLGQTKVVINEYVDLSEKTVALDVEHDESGNFVGCGIYLDSTNTVYYFSDISVLFSLDFSTVHVVAHNGQSDFDLLRLWGASVKEEQLVWDTFLMGHIIDSSLKTYGLKDMAKRELGMEWPSYDDIVGKRTAKQKNERTTLDKQPVPLVSAYNACDCVATYRLYEKQRKNDQNSSPQLACYFNDLEKPVSRIFAQMENRGISVDLDYLKTLQSDLEQQQGPIKQSIIDALGDINLNSSKQLLEALHAKEIYPTLKNKASTDKRALAALRSSPIVDSLLKYSEIDTLLTSFVTPYLERGQKVVHPFYNQCGTRTGRVSCSNPNLLQIPRRTANGQMVRRMFIPRPGMLMGDVDLGQIEPRVLAHLSQDPALYALFNNSIDFHTYTSERLGIDRDRAKVLNLSVGYRATFRSVAQQLKCTDKEAQDEIDKWWRLFPGLRRWQDKLIYESKRSGTCTTLFGRQIKVDDLNNGNKWRREASERQLINNITQGSAAEIIKKMMIDIIDGYPEIGLLCQVYDELLFEAKKEQMDDVMIYIIDKMTNSGILKVPITLEWGTGINWSACNKVGK